MVERTVESSPGSEQEPESGALGLAARLAALRDALGGAGDDPRAGLAAWRRDLAALRTELEPCGTNFNDSPDRSRLTLALRRLEVAAELGECLAGEAGEGDAAATAAFCAEGLDRLARAADLGQLGTARDEDGLEAAIVWILGESVRCWGPYLGLLAACGEAHATADGSLDGGAILDDPDRSDMALGPDDEFDLSGAASWPGPEADADIEFELGEAPGLAADPSAEADAGAEASEYVDPRPAHQDDATPADGQADEAGPAIGLGELLRLLKAGPDDASDAARDHQEGEAVATAEDSNWGQPAPPCPPADPTEVLAALEPELRDAFLADAADLFERIQALVLEDLARAPAGPDGAADRARAMRELARCYHTLKGASGSVGLLDMAAKIHDLEDRLEAAETGSDGAAEAPLDLLHESLGELEGLLDELSGNIRAPMAAALSRTTPAPMTTATTQAEPVEPETSEAPASAPIAPAPPPPTEGFVRVPAARIDEMMDLVSELIGRRGQWAAGAEAIRRLATDAQAARNRLAAGVDRLRDLDPDAGGAGDPGASPVSSALARLTEQADDLAALAESARAAADPLADDADALARLSLRLWDCLQAVRVVPVRGLFHRLARVAREAAREAGRAVEVILSGEDAGIDRSVQDKAFEPLLHAVRNAVSHGIESVADRIKAGKPPLGRITLEARREGSAVVLSVHDDGRGLDHAAIAAKGRQMGLLADNEPAGAEQLHALLFRPGFSTRSEADGLSGRGVGMDVIAQEVGRLHGTVGLTSRAGEGTTLTVRLPARLALEQSLVMRLAGRPFALPLAAIERAGEATEGEAAGQPSEGARAAAPPVEVEGRRALGLPPAPPHARPRRLVLRAGAETPAVALSVDSIDGPQELVTRPLGALLGGHPLVAGTSLSPAGELVLMLDAVGLARFGVPARPQTPARGRNVAARREAAERDGGPDRALVVDDALSVRRAAGKRLRALGLEADEAADGLEALRMARSGAYRLILVDLELPRLDGFELLAELNRSGLLSQSAAVVLSAHADPAARRRALALGARAVLAKPVGPDALARAVVPLLSREAAAAPV